MEPIQGAEGTSSLITDPPKMLVLWQDFGEEVVPDEEVEVGNRERRPGSHPMRQCHRICLQGLLDKWAYEKGVTMDFSRPGKPMDNAMIELFKGSFRDECLNVNWSLSMEDAQEKIEKWRRDYNEFRPHS
jgi:hypothetical protein